MKSNDNNLKGRTMRRTFKNLPQRLELEYQTALDNDRSLLIGQMWYNPSAFTFDQLLEIACEKTNAAGTWHRDNNGFGKQTWMFIPAGDIS